jgi:elongation factor G
VLKAAIRRLTCKIELVPVLCGSAFKKRGVQPLVDAVVDYLPSPLDVPGAEGITPGTEQKSSRCRRRQRQVLFAGVQALDRSLRGKLVFFRVYSGQLKKGDTIYNPRTRKRERVSRLMMIQGSDKRKDVDDFCRRHRRAGRPAQHHHRRHAVRRGFRRDARTADVPRAGHQHGRRAEDQGRTATRCPKACSAWRKKTRRSAAFTNEETGQLIIAGMGELHLEIIIDRLFREFKVEANTGAPQIAYRETITKAAEGEGKFIRQSGGAANTATPASRLRPMKSGKGVEIENKIVGGAIPKEYIPAVIDGIEEAIKGGVLCGLPGH